MTAVVVEEDRHRIWMVVGLVQMLLVPVSDIVVAVAVVVLMRQLQLMGLLMVELQGLVVAPAAGMGMGHMGSLELMKVPHLTMVQKIEVVDQLKKEEEHMR